MKIPTDSLKSLLSTLTGKGSPGEPVPPDPTATLFPGREVNAEVLERQPNGRYLVRAGGELFDMKLPGRPTPGNPVRLTYLGDSPRPTFSLSSSSLKGSDVSLSSAGKWLGTITSNPLLQEKSVPVPSSRPPLISNESMPNRPMIAARLKEAVGRSGLFYESHLARWREGQYPLSELLEEPQARESSILGEKQAKDPLPDNAGPSMEGSRQSMTARTTSGATTLQSGKNNTDSGISAGELPATQHDTAADGPLKSNRQPTQSTQAASSETPLLTEPSDAGVKTQPPLATDTNAMEKEFRQTDRSSLDKTTKPAPSSEQLHETPVQGDATPNETAAAKKTVTSLRSGQESTTPDQVGPHPKAAAPPLPTQLPPISLAKGDAHDDYVRFPSPPSHPESQETEIPSRRSQPSIPLRQEAPQGRVIHPMYAEPSPPVSDRTPREALVIAGSREPVPSFEPPHPQTLPIIRQQLEFLQNGEFVWHGEAWNGQQIEWKIGKEERRKEKSGDTGWNTSLNLELPNLGRISARLQLKGNEIRISVVAEEESAAELMEKEKERLAEGMEAGGIRLSAMEIRRAPASSAS